MTRLFLTPTGHCWSFIRRHCRCGCGALWVGGRFGLAAPKDGGHFRGWALQRVRGRLDHCARNQKRQGEGEGEMEGAARVCRKGRVCVFTFSVLREENTTFSSTRKWSVYWVVSGSEGVWEKCWRGRKNASLGKRGLGVPRCPQAA